MNGLWLVVLAGTLCTAAQALPEPWILPNGGTYQNPIIVVVVPNLQGPSPLSATTLRYTVDGSAPRANSPIVRGLLLLTGTVA